MAIISPSRGRPQSKSPARRHGALPGLRHTNAAAAIAALLALTGAAANATTLNVPGTFSTIQLAIGSASNGDTIVVAPGIYTGTGFRDIDFLGKSITVKSSGGAAVTVLDLQGSSATPHRGFRFHSNETSSAVVQGFTIENGFQDFGAGILMSSSSGSTSPVVKQCVFLSNTATVQGGAIAASNGSPTIAQNVFLGNQAWTAAGDVAQVGGAIEILNDDSSAQTVTIVNNSFAGNRAGDDGGAIDVTSFDAGSNPVITTPVVNIDNNSFSGNIALGDGAPVDASHQPGTIDAFGGKEMLSNNILFGDTTSVEISTLDPLSSNAVVHFNDIQGTYTGPGGASNVNTTPLYENPAGLLQLTALSTQINAGTAVGTTPSVDLNGNPRSSSFARGAYEYAMQVTVGSFSPSQNINFNGQVATFLDTSGELDAAADYTATINWGDGATTAGTVSQPGGSGTAYAVTGSHTYTTSGAQTVTVTITDSNPVLPLITASGTNSITVQQAVATAFVVSAPASTTFGSAFSFTVTAVDGSLNTITGYTGTVHFTSTDGAATLPADATLTNGVGTFSATLNTLGNQTITATDTVTAITGTSGTINVLTGPVTHFSVSAPGAATAGTSFNATVTALDSGNHTVTSYAGTVHFTTTSSSYNLPADSTLTNGVGTFSVKLNTAGNQTLTAEDTTTTSINGTSGTITVSAGPAGFFNVVSPSTVIQGVPFNITVNAFDSFGNAATTYTGPVSFNSGDGAAVLPGNSALVAGTGTFSVTLNTLGTQSIDVHDVASPGITGNTGPITVQPGGVTHFGLSAPATAMAGDTVNVTVTALDALNNVVTGYTGTVKITTSDGHASLPANSKLTNGVKTFSVVLRTAMNTAVTATDTVNASITGTATVAVSAGPATRFRINLRGNAVAGSPYAGNVQATDLYGNAITSYNGTVHFTSTDGAATLPADTTLTNGAANFNATFYTIGSQTLTVTDTVTPSMTSTSVPFSVVAGPVTHFGISAPASATVGGTFSVTVTALDRLGNTVTGYTGTVHFTSTDGHAVLPANATLVNGVKTFNVTLRTSGSQTVTATDTVKASITGAATITVAPAAPARFRINLRGNPKAGTPYQFSVQATDIYGNATPTYSGTVHFTSTDGAATLPADTTLSGGIGYFAATFRTVGSQTFTLTDTINASITSTSAVLTVAP